MSQLINHSCPSIVCPAFKKPFSVECWDEGEQEYGEGQSGEPCCYDENRCTECGTICPYSNELDGEFMKMVKMWLYANRS